MCGIAGIVRWGRELPQEAEIQRMTRAIAHRGPDGEGLLVRDRVAIGHRRLSIIDLATGAQPMANEDQQVWVTFNGEIYNFQELTAQLKAAGHQFRSRCDTEVIIHGYEEWGPACVEKFRGMFAFAVVDYRHRRVFLARDHFGIKPLYYRCGPDFFAFGSELPALRQVDAPVPDGCLAAVEMFLRYKYVPSPQTIYRDVYKLPPASWLTVDFDGRMDGPHSYWDLRFEPDGQVDEREWEERLDAAIAESVQAHLVADVPFGVFLSGGIDSTLVALYMSRILKTPVRAFSIGFDHEEVSELPFAREAAQRCGVSWRSEVVSGASLEMLPELVAHYGEPFGDSSAIPTWHVARLARSEVPMVLSGDGGDEAFAGYDSYAAWMNLGAEATVYQLRRLVRRLAWGRAWRLLRRRLRAGTWNFVEEWEEFCMTCAVRPVRQALWRPEHQELVAQRCGPFQEAARAGARLDRLEFAQYVDYRTYLPGDILVKVDVASMCHGLEVRVPLIDLRVVELAMRLPLALRRRAEPQHGVVGKYLPKRLLGRTFPPEFTHRKKQGFAIPQAQWLGPGTPGRRKLDELLASPRCRLHELFRPEAVRAYSQAQADAPDQSVTAWLLLVLAIWLEQNPTVCFR